MCVALYTFNTPRENYYRIRKFPFGDHPAIKASRNELANCHHSCSHDAVGICEPAETKLDFLQHEKYDLPNAGSVCDFESQAAFRRYALEMIEKYIFREKRIRLQTILIIENRRKNEFLLSDN